MAQQAPDRPHPVSRTSVHYGLLERREAPPCLGWYPRPSLEQVTLLVRIWLRRWVEACFKRELQTPEGQDAYQRLLAGLASPATDWQSIDAGFLIREKNHPLIYSALPSLLAARLTRP